MGLYETRGKMKHEFYILMKRTLNLFLLKNNMSVSLCPRRFCVLQPHSPLFHRIWARFIQNRQTTGERSQWTLIHDVLHRLLLGTTVTIRNVCKTPSVHQGTTSTLISPETIQKDPFMSTQLKTGGAAIRIQD
jgi:hypothetical protein